MGSGADMSEQAKVEGWQRTRGTDKFDVSMSRDPVDLFPVKMCPTCEEVECQCEESLARRLEEATEQIIDGMGKLTVALGELANRGWRG